MLGSIGREPVWQIRYCLLKTQLQAWDKQGIGLLGSFFQVCSCVYSQNYFQICSEYGKALYRTLGYFRVYLGETRKSDFSDSNSTLSISISHFGEQRYKLDLSFYSSSLLVFVVEEKLFIIRLSISERQIQVLEINFKMK